MRKITAVAPYRHPEYLNFKMAAYEAWCAVGGDVAPAHYPWRWLHGLAFRCELPNMRCMVANTEARLRFVEPVSVSFDAFPDYATHEVIPFIWDCWPCYYDKMEKWMTRHQVQTAIFTSRQEMEEMKRRLPAVKMLHCPEGIDTSLYGAGKALKDRTIDVLEFGRSNKKVWGSDVPFATDNIRHVCTCVQGKFIYDNEQLREAMGDAKVVIALPRSITQPDIAGGVETLTQRYWENMLSRNVMIGHAPQELVDLIGYNPCVELPLDLPAESLASAAKALVLDVLSHIEDYQELVDRNRQTALALGDWKVRMQAVRAFLNAPCHSLHPCEASRVRPQHS